MALSPSVAVVAAATPPQERLPCNIQVSLHGGGGWVMVVHYSLTHTTSRNNNNIIIADTAAVGGMLKIAFATVITRDRAC